MTKQYYQILEVSETATQEEIKKAYRKLATKWHPDKWTTKSLTEKETANKKMQEINKAYEVLGNEELRKRYDLGETGFTSYASTSDNFDWQSYYETEREKLRTEAEKIRWQLEAVNQKEAISAIGFEMLINEVYPNRLDSKLWTPYGSWQEKVINLGIIIDANGRVDKINSELHKFQAEMINAIRKRKEEWKTGINNPYFDRTKASAIETIEEVMKKKGLKTEDLGEYSNYQEQINNLNRQWKIRNLKDKIIVYIKNMENNKGRSEKTEKDFNFLDEVSGNQNYPEKKARVWKPHQESSTEDIDHKNTNEVEINGEYDNWTREELITEIKQKQLDNDKSKKIITVLEKKIEELEEEIKELKAETPQTSEIKQEIQKRETQLQEARNSLVKINNLNSEKSTGDIRNKSDNNFPTGLVIGGGVLLTMGLIALILIKKTKKNKFKK